MSLAIGTEVTLTTGKKVKAFYLSEEGKKALRNLQFFKNRVELLENQADTLGKIVAPIAVAYFEKRIMETLPNNKSVHSWDFMQTLRVANPFYSASRQAWENLLAKGEIEDRGSGWYRKKGENKRESK